MGIVLAGGSSRRMGTDKAAVLVGGRAMSDWVVGAMKRHLSEVVAVGREGRLSGIDAIPDEWRDRRGPLAGLATVLRRFARPVVLVAVDQPLLRPETVARLAAVGDPAAALVPYDQVPQVTCARYPVEWAAEAGRALESGRSLTDLVRATPHLRVDAKEWSGWGEDGRSWFSFDDEASILDAERRFRIDLQNL